MAIPIVPAVAYACGFIIHTVRNMNVVGKNERDEYIKNMETQKETPYKTKFEAYWNGCRNGLFYGIVDSAIWPVKAAAFLYFVVRNNDDPKHDP